VITAERVGKALRLKQRESILVGGRRRRRGEEERRERID